MSWVFCVSSYVVRLTRSHYCVLGSFWFVLCGQTHAVTLLCPGFFLVCLMWSDSRGHTNVSWVLFVSSYVVRLTRSQSCVLGSFWFVLCGQTHAVTLLCLGFLLVSSVRLTRSHSCVLGSFWFVLCGQTHAVTLLCPGFFLVCLMWSDSRGHTPVSWVLFGLSYVVRLKRSHYCVLGSCSFRLMWSDSSGHTPVVLGSFWFVLCGQTHAVTLLCPGFFLVCLMWSDSRGHTPVSWVRFGLSYVVSGHTPVSWVLFGLSYVVRLTRSHSCVLGSFWFVLCGQTHAVTLLCPGFFLVCLMWSDSRGHTPVSWVLFVSSYVVRLTRSHSCVLGSFCFFLCGQTHAVTLLCLGFLCVSSNFFVRLKRSHSCVLGSLWFVLCGQTHAVTLLCPGFLFV